MKAFEKDVLKRVFKPLSERVLRASVKAFEKDVLKHVFKPLSARFEAVCDSL